MGYCWLKDHTALSFSFISGWSFWKTFEKFKVWHPVMQHRRGTLLSWTLWWLVIKKLDLELFNVLMRMYIWMRKVGFHELCSKRCWHVMLCKERLQKRERTFFFLFCFLLLYPDLLLVRVLHLRYAHSDFCSELDGGKRFSSGHKVIMDVRCFSNRLLFNVFHGNCFVRY